MSNIDLEKNKYGTEGREDEIFFKAHVGFWGLI